MILTPEEAALLLTRLWDSPYTDAKRAQWLALRERIEACAARVPPPLRRLETVDVPRKHGMSLTFHPEAFTLLWPAIGTGACRMSTYGVVDVDRWADDGGAKE